jgi:hypothetical protein
MRKLRYNYSKEKASVIYFSIINLVNREGRIEVVYKNSTLRYLNT